NVQNIFLDSYVAKSSFSIVQKQMLLLLMQMISLFCNIYSYFFDYIRKKTNIPQFHLKENVIQYLICKMKYCDNRGIAVLKRNRLACSCRLGAWGSGHQGRLGACGQALILHN
ncbi:MAG: hypothetical protein ACYCYE_09325, partial [Clostridia bacterium]